MFNQQFDKMEKILINAKNTLVRINMQAKIDFAKSLVRSRINYGLLIYLNATRLLHTKDTEILEKIMEYMIG